MPFPQRFSLDGDDWQLYYLLPHEWRWGEAPGWAAAVRTPRLAESAGPLGRSARSSVSPRCSRGVVFARGPRQPPPSPPGPTGRPPPSTSPPVRPAAGGTPLRPIKLALEGAAA